MYHFYINDSLFIYVHSELVNRFIFALHVCYDNECSEIILLIGINDAKKNKQSNQQRKYLNFFLNNA